MRVSTEDLKMCSASYGTDQIYHLPYIFVGRATYNLSVEYRSPNRTVRVKWPLPAFSRSSLS